MRVHVPVIVKDFIRFVVFLVDAYIFAFCITFDDVFDGVRDGGTSHVARSVCDVNARVFGDDEPGVVHCVPHSLYLSDPTGPFPRCVGVIHVCLHSDYVRDPVRIAYDGIKGNAEDPWRERVAHVHPNVDKDGFKDFSHNFGDGSSWADEGFDYL